MNILTKTIDRITGHQRLTLTETQRALLLHKGRFNAILTPGEHRIPRTDVVMERHNLDQLVFTSDFEDALQRTRPELADRHLTRFRAGPDEMLVILRDGRPFRVLGPEGLLTVWTEAGPWEAEPHRLTETLEVPPKVAKRLAKPGLNTLLMQVEVPEGHTGILTVEGVFKGQLAPGAHAFWRAGSSIAVKQVDLRQRTHEVTGQEILTKDRVTIRVNLSADFRVTDPVKAVSTVKDFEAALHRALQLAFRKTLGALTLDRLLAEKVAVDTGAAEAVRAEMAGIGIEVGGIALKDVILPGEMREILTAVVAAEKQAEANVIRRREETNATRSLLNTAKVMAENPVMLRLKELEALESI
ncbi:MAG: slipin family protein, partial [Leisingera sp.]